MAKLRREKICIDCGVPKSRVGNRCKDCRIAFNKANKRRYECSSCGKSITRGADKGVCKTCWHKNRTIPRPNCIDCGSVLVEIKSKRCLACHNIKQDQGLSRERTKFQNSYLWKKTRLEIFGRDNFCCTRCGQDELKPKRLNCHHVRPWALFSDLRLEPSNLTTLCLPCHKLTHKEIGRITSKDTEHGQIQADAT